MASTVDPLGPHQVNIPRILESLDTQGIRTILDIAIIILKWYMDTIVTVPHTAENMEILTTHVIRL